MQSLARNLSACEGITHVMAYTSTQCSTNCSTSATKSQSRRAVRTSSIDNLARESASIASLQYCTTAFRQSWGRSRHSRQKRQRLICTAEKTFRPFGPGEVREIPIFPLSGIVALPGSDVPLNIFEARYRVLFNTMLAGAEGIEDDLVNPDKPWHGTRLFGMCFISGEGRMSNVGTTLHIRQHHRFPDGRMGIVTQGMEKFQVLEVLESKPVVVCKVKILEDSDDQTLPMTQLSDSTVQQFKDLVSLNVKMQSLPEEKAKVNPKLEGMTPKEASYWLASIFDQVPVLQQSLLEENDLEKRLSKIKEILEGSTSYLRAQLALKSAFSSDTATPDAPEASSSSPSKQDQSSDQTSGKPADELEP